LSKPSKALSKGLGPRYGFTVRRRYAEIIHKRRSKYKCPRCELSILKRLSIGIWQCRKCGFTKVAILRYSLRLSFRLRPTLARVIGRALLPEMRWRAEWIAKLQVRKNTLVIKLDSRTLSRLRAATNTLLRWIEMVEDVVNLLEET